MNENFSHGVAVVIHTIFAWLKRHDKQPKGVNVKFCIFALGAISIAFGSTSNDCKEGLVLQKGYGDDSYVACSDTVNKYIKLVENKVKLSRTGDRIEQSLEYDGLSINWRNIVDSTAPIEISKTSNHWKLLSEDQRIYLLYYIGSIKPSWKKENQDLWLKMQLGKSGKIVPVQFN